MATEVMTSGETFSSRLLWLEEKLLSHEERLNFLDPEVKTTNSRLDIISMECKANNREIRDLVEFDRSPSVFHQTDISSKTSSSYYSSMRSQVNKTNYFFNESTIEGSGNTSRSASRDFNDYCTEMENLWSHALDVLDRSDVDELYKFKDDTGILEAHKLKFEKSSIVANTKDKFFELIKMILEKESSEKKDKYKDIKEVRKIQGYQDLTNLLLRGLTKKLMNENHEMKERLRRIETIIGEDNEDGTQILVKLNEVNSKLENVCEETMNNTTRLGGLEVDVKNLKEESKKRDALDDIYNESTKLQKEIVEKLEKRIDANEENLNLLMDNDRKQDEMLEALESSVIPNMKSKLEELENADEFLRTTHQNLLQKTDKAQESLDKLKVQKDQDDEKLNSRIHLILENEENLKKKVDEFVQKQEEANNDVDKELEYIQNEMAEVKNRLSEEADMVDGLKDKTKELNELKKQVDDVEEKIGQVKHDEEKNSEALEKLAEQHGDKIETLSKDLDNALKTVHENTKQNKEGIDELNERVKYNYERLDKLTELPLKVENLFKITKENSGFIHEAQDKIHKLEDRASNLEAKIIDEADLREKEDKELEHKIKETNEFVKGDLNDVRVDVRDLTGRLVNLEEQQNTQIEKVNFVQALAGKVNDEKQQSEAKMRDEIESQIKNQKTDLEKLLDELENKVKELQSEANVHSDEIHGIKDKTSTFDQELNLIKQNYKDEVNKELENLNRTLEEKLGEVDEASRVNGQHVENLRELNTKLAMDVNSLRKENLEKIEEKINNLRKEIPNVKESDVEDLLKQRLTTEGQLKDLQDTSKSISEELLETQKSLREKNDHVLLKITEAISKTESSIEVLKQQFFVIESAGKDEVRKDLDELKIKTKEETEALKEKIDAVDSSGKQRIMEVDEKTCVVQTQVKSFRTELDKNSTDLWSIMLKLYGTLRNYTIVLVSEGSAAEHQPACLGVYRSIGSRHELPIYKQDNGENFLYYNLEQKSWMVGSGVGNNYAWMRCLASDGEEDSSSSSSGSDNESEEEEAGKPLTRTGAPDLFSSVWEYKMSSLQVPEDDRWMSDDWSLKAMALGDVDSISPVIKEIRGSKEID